MNWCQNRAFWTYTFTWKKKGACPKFHWPKTIWLILYERVPSRADTGFRRQILMRSFLSQKRDVTDVVIIISRHRMFHKCVVTHQTNAIELRSYRFGTGELKASKRLISGKVFLISFSFWTLVSKFIDSPDHSYPILPGSRLLIKPRWTKKKK